MKKFLLLLLIILGIIITSCSSREERSSKSYGVIINKSEKVINEDSLLINTINSFSKTAIVYDKFIENGIGYLLINQNDSLYFCKGSNTLFKRIYHNQTIGYTLRK